MTSRGNARSVAATLARWKSRVKSPRKPKLRLTPSHTPIDCVVLAVDTAKNSGWSLWVRGKYVDSGEIGIMDHGRMVARIRYCMGVVMDSGLSSEKFVLVLERSWGGGRHQIEGLGAARHAWLSAWCDAHATKTPRRVVRVYPATWRARIFGTTKQTSGRESSFGLVHKGSAAGGDEAAAICIGAWASHAGEVAAVLAPKPKKAKAA